MHWWAQPGSVVRFPVMAADSFSGGMGVGLRLGSWRRSGLQDFTVHGHSHDRCMRHKKRKKERADATRASVKKEMAKPRMARSARMMELILDTTRNPGQPSTTKP